MNPPGRKFHTLDKDLRRVTAAEHAQFHVVRPVVRVGAVILLVVALLLMVMGAQSQQPGLIVAAAGVMVAGWLGLSIGANDVSNSLGPAVGAGAIGLGPGLALVAAAEIAGAILAGHHVAHRLAAGIVDRTVLSGTGGQAIMLAALIGAASWITMATAARLPVSTSHSIVGAIAGAGLAAAGSAAVAWDSIAVMVLAWILTPLAAAVLAGGLLAFLRRRVAEAEDRGRAALFWLPLLIGLMVGLFVNYVVTLLPARSLQLPGALVPGVAVGIATALLMRRRVAEVVAENLGSRPAMKRILRAPLLFAAVMMAFAHGAGDSGNVAAPLMVILTPQQPGPVQAPYWSLLIGGAMIAVGAVLFGRQLVGMVAQGITRLNPARAFCITLSTAVIVLISSGLGLPVSSTHVAVGGVFGVGFARELLDRRDHRPQPDLPIEERRRRLLIRRSHVVTISTAWLVTVPLAAMLGALACLAILRLA